MSVAAVDVHHAKVKVAEMAYQQAYDEDGIPSESRGKETILYPMNDATADEHTPLRTPDNWFPEGKRSWLFGFYIFAVCYNSVTFLILTVVMEPDGPHLKVTSDGDRKETGLFGWHFVHLTYWGGLTQIAYFVVCIVDSLHRHDVSWSSFHTHRDRFFGLAFGLGTFICVGFWAVVFPGKSNLEHDREHRYGFYSAFADHGATSIFIWLEALCVFHRYPSRVTVSEGVIPFIYCTAYLLWNLLCHVETHAWAYPIQYAFSMPVRYVLYPAFPFLFVGAYYICRSFHNWWWRKRRMSMSLVMNE